MRFDVDIVKHLVHCRDERQNVVANMESPEPSAPQAARRREAVVELVKVEDDEHAVGLQVRGHSFEGTNRILYQRESVGAKRAIGGHFEIDCGEISLHEPRSRTFSLSSGKHGGGKIDADDFRCTCPNQRRKVQPGTASKIDNTMAGINFEKGVSPIAARQNPAAGGIIKWGLSLVEALYSPESHTNSFNS
jgi:hypothetical protein